MHVYRDLRRAPPGTRAQGHRRLAGRQTSGQTAGQDSGQISGQTSVESGADTVQIVLRTVFGRVVGQSGGQPMHAQLGVRNRDAVAARAFCMQQSAIGRLDHIVDVLVFHMLRHADAYR